MNKALFLVFVLVAPGLRHLLFNTSKPEEACATYNRVAPLITQPMKISELPVIIVAYNATGKPPDVCKGLPILLGEQLIWGDIVREEKKPGQDKVGYHVDSMLQAIKRFTQQDTWEGK